MNFAPYQWRADKGYIPQPGSMPAPLLPSPPYWAFPPPQQYYPTPFPGYGGYAGPVVAMPPPRKPDVPSVASTPAPSPPAPSVKKVEPPKKKIEVVLLKMDRSIVKLPSVAPGESCSGRTELIVASDKKSSSASNKAVVASDKKSPSKPDADDAKTIAHSTNTMAPPSLRPGMNYMFPPTPEHTMLHIFNKASKIWEAKYAGQKLAFKTFKVSTKFSVRNVVERVLKGDNEKSKGWVVTEVFESGDGGWRKGSTIKYDDDKSKGDLASMGWNKNRGAELAPVWLVVHKA